MKKEKSMSTKKTGFTIAEIAIALTVIGIFMVIFIVALSKDKGREEIINKTTTSSLFANISEVYESLLNYKCNNRYSIYYLEDLNNDKKSDSKDIAEYLASTYTGAIASNCNELAKPSNFNLLSDTTCMDLAPNAFIAVSLDKKCKTSLTYNEYLGQSNKTINNACGYIAYSIKNSKGVLGQDFFIFPFTKNTRTKKTVKN